MREMQVRLKVLKGTKAGKEIKLPMPQCLVGRSDQCHLRTQNDAISSRHCVITATETVVLVRDLKSLNGTFVNGEKVAEEAVLHCGDQLRIGPLLFEVFIELAQAKRKVVHDLHEVATGTAGGNANLSTLIVASSKRITAPDAVPGFDEQPDSEESPFAEDSEQLLLETGQSVVVSGGILEGATGTVVRKVAGGRYLVSLEGQEGEIWAKIPSHLLRAV